MGLVSWRLNSPEIRLLIQQLIWTNKIENINSSHCWAFLKGTHQWPVDIIHKGPSMRKVLPCFGVIMYGIKKISGTIDVNDELLEFAKLGCINEFDLFGLECSWFQPNPSLDMPSDGQRVRALKLLIDEGYGENIVIAHDIHTKHRLVWYSSHWST